MSRTFAEISGPDAWAPARALRAALRTPAAILILAIRIYQRTLSPLLPVVTAGACACRFAPTCSHYAADAIRIHGAVRGAWLALRRLVKCTPLHPGGFDPVPPRAERTITKRNAGSAPRFRPASFTCRAVRP